MDREGQKRFAAFWLLASLIGLQPRESEGSAILRTPLFPRTSPRVIITINTFFGGYDHSQNSHKDNENIPL